jgi:hypothetical protein
MQSTYLSYPFLRTLQSRDYRIVITTKSYWYVSNLQIKVPQPYMLHPNNAGLSCRHDSRNPVAGAEI